MMPAIKRSKLPYVDKLNPRWSGDTPQAVEARRRKNLFAALNQVVTEHLGSITSVPGAKIVKMEIPKDSELPEKLKRLGYSPMPCGSITRITGTGFTAYDVIEISLA